MSDKDFTIQCKQCDTAFKPALTKAGVPRKNQPSYCSDKCKWTARNRNKPGRSKAPASAMCKACGNEFKPSKADNTMFCSLRCKACHHNNSHKYAHGPLPQWASKKTINAVKIVDRCLCCDSYGHVTNPKASYVLCRDHLSISSDAKLLFSKGATVRTCPVCLAEFCRVLGLGKGNRNPTCLSEECSDTYNKNQRRKEKRIEKATRRARQRGLGAENIDPIKVFERDRWRCHLCGQKTDIAKRGTSHAKAPELEHIISLSDGGSHTWGNVACSCRSCNGMKGSRSIGQTLLNFPI